MSGRLKQCPFCANTVYFKKTKSGVVFFKCDKCGARITFEGENGTVLPTDTAKHKFNQRV